MECVVFLRGVNVGTHILRTAQFITEFAPWEPENIGAAGTFTFRRAPAEPVLRRRLTQALPFPAEMCVIEARRLIPFVRRAPFGTRPEVKGVRRAVAFLTTEPSHAPKTPFDRPTGEPWGVRVLSADPPYVLCRNRRLRGNRMLYPNAVVEREFGVPSTTRWWETVVEAARRLAPGAS